jgi:hypothetical protein
MVLEFYSYYEYPNPNLQKNIKNQCFSIWIREVIKVKICKLVKTRVLNTLFQSHYLK